VYRLVGMSELLKTAYMLSYPYLHRDQEVTATTLKTGLRQHLKVVQPGVARSSELVTEFMVADASTRALLDILELTEQPSCSSDPALVLRKVIASFAFIGQSDGQLGELFRTVVDRVLVTTNVNVPGSASSPRAIGVLWIQPTDEWEEQDFVEALIHELTHTLLYLDEQRYVHYIRAEALQDKSTWVASAIRSEARPVNGVAHSILVATEILCLRRDWQLGHNGIALHGDSNIILSKTVHALDELQNQPDSWNLLSPRMQSLLHLAGATLTSLEQEGLSQRL